MNRSSTTSDDILACARSLIVTGGYNGFSYADIADVVGIRKASIHHHFPSKTDLVRTLVGRYREAAEEGIANLERGIPGPLEQLRAYIGYWKACIGDASAPFCVCALLASELPILPEEVALEIRAYFRFLSGWLTRRAWKRKSSWRRCTAPCCPLAPMAIPPSSVTSWIRNCSACRRKIDCRPARFFYESYLPTSR